MDWILEEPAKNYYLNLFECASGAFEAILKTVRPMQMEEAKRRFENFNPVSASASVERARREELDPESVAQEKRLNHDRAVRRSKQKIRLLCKQMEADRLFTLTYRKNMECRETVRADFQEFLRLTRKGFKVKHADGTVTEYAAIPDWQYVAVLEKQDRGALHIHCAVQGFQRIKTLRAAWYKALGGNGDERGEDTPGQVDVTSPKNRLGVPSSRTREWKTEKLAGYICKYIAETFDEMSSEKKRYWHARDVKAPAKQRIWIGATNIVDAIKATVRFLDLHVGLKPDFDMWLSSTGDCFWIAGRCS